MLSVIYPTSNDKFMESNNGNLVLKKSEIWKVFDIISPKYDFLNHFLSLGFDILWRRKLIKFLPLKKSSKILDLATGTADVLLTFCRRNDNIQSAVGIDLAEKMLKIGRKKIEQQGLQDKISLQQADIHQLPFPNDSFDCVTIAFGIRNTEDPPQVLREMFRVLQKDGKALILEFSLPLHWLWRSIYLFYLRHLVPGIGFLLSGHKEAYRYLNQTIESFPCGEHFCSLMGKTGFQKIQFYPLMGGIATIYTGKK